MPRDRERGQSLVLALVIGVVILTAMALIGLLVAYFGGAVLDPFHDVIVDETSDHSVDFISGASLAFTLGFAVVLPLIIIVPTVWFFVAGLRTDTGPGRGRL